MYSIIIVDYYSIEQTVEYMRHCCECITDIGHAHFVIVDLSADGQGFNKLLDEYQNITLLSVYKENEIYLFHIMDIEFLLVCARGNLGYGRGNNLGARIAQQYFHDAYYVFSNNDIVFQQLVSINTLIDIMENDQSIGVIGPKISSPDGTAQSPMKYTSMWQQTVLDLYHMVFGRLIRRFESNIDYEGYSKYCYAVCGCFMMARANSFETVGGFDERVFLYSEEQILSERMKVQNYCVYYYNDISVIHNHNTTMRSNMSEIRRISLSIHSTWYYFQEYMKVPCYQIVMAKILFAIFKPLYIMKIFLLRIIRKEY